MSNTAGKDETDTKGADEIVGDDPRTEPISGGVWLVNIFVCLAAGITSAMMNFGFVFGEDIRDEAELLGHSEFLAALPVWFLAFNMGTIPGVAYASYLLTVNGTWHKLRWNQDLTLRRSVPIATLSDSMVYCSLHMLTPS